MQIIPGLSGFTSNPVNYTMRYANPLPPFYQDIDYRERFAVLNISSGYVNAAGGVIDKIINAAISDVEAAASGGAVATSGAAAIPAAALTVLAEVLRALYNWGSSWFKKVVLNSDGSLTIEIAYHYCGVPAGGLDLTAWPLPGVPTATWTQVVNNLMNVTQSLGREPAPENLPPVTAIGLTEQGQPVSADPAAANARTGT